MSNGIDAITSQYLNSQSLFSTVATGTTTDQITDPFADPNGPFANLNLSAEQQQQIQQIFSSNSGSSAQTPTQLFSQVESVLTPQQQQTLQTDLETHAHHHHHHAGGSSESTNLLSQLNLTSAQQTQVDSILQTAQQSGSSTNVLSQIADVLTPAQQTQLTALLSSYTSTGATAPAHQPITVNTSA